MEILVTGSNGQLGRALRLRLPQATFTDIDDLDITDQAAVDQLGDSKFDVIINAAAYTNVDSAETEDGKKQAEKINVDGVRNLAALAKKHQAVFVHISTDYVFDGTSTTPYREIDAQNPLSVYGKTKAKGEKEATSYERHYLVRTSWVYGDGKNFVKTMLQLAETHDELSVVSDQTGRPTSADDLAWAICELIHRKAPFGVYNVTNSGEPITWADFAREIFGLKNLTTVVHAITTTEYTKGKNGIAPRPSYSVLDISKLEHIGVHMPHWKHALKSYLEKQ